MNSANLIPQRRLLRFWTRVILGYAALLAAVIAAGRLARGPAASSERQPQRAAQRVEQSERAMTAVRPPVASARPH